MSTSKPTIIHAGFPKTGSTYLQKKIFPSLINGIYLHFDRKGKFLLDDAALSSSDNILISQENLLGYPRNSKYLETRNNLAKGLKRIFPNSQIIIFFREPSSWIESSYKQYILQGGTYSFEKYCTTRPTKLEYTDFIKTLKKINFENLILINYQKFKEDPDFVVDYIENRTGLRFEKRPRDIKKQSNVSLSNPALKIAKCLNHLSRRQSHPQKEGSPTPEYQININLFFRIMNKLVAKTIRTLQTTDVFSNLPLLQTPLVTSEQKDQIKSANQKDWEEAKTYFDL